MTLRLRAPGAAAADTPIALRSRLRFVSGSTATPSFDNTGNDAEMNSGNWDSLTKVEDDGSVAHIATAADFDDDTVYELEFFNLNVEPLSGAVPDRDERATIITTGSWIKRGMIPLTGSAYAQRAVDSFQNNIVGAVDTTAARRANYLQFASSGPGVFFGRGISANGADLADTDRIWVRGRGADDAIRIHEFYIEGDAVDSGGQSDDPLTPTQVMAAIRAAGWPGDTDPDDDTGLSFEALSDADPTNLGYDATRDDVVIGDNGWDRGRLVFTDPDRLTDNRDALLQCAVQWEDGGQYSFFIGMGTDLPASTTTDDPRTIYGAGNLLRVKTSVRGETHFSMVETEGATSHWPADGHGAWDLESVQNIRLAAQADYSDADERRATFIASGTLHGDGVDPGDEYLAIAVQVYRNRVAVFFRGQHLATWIWTPANDPTRSGRPQHRNYLIHSSAGNSIDVGGENVTPTQRVRAFGVTPARSDAPAANYFI